VSREALALDISRVVSRLVSGEPIDTAERGAALAAKYPDLGMNAELIGQAIDRAAGMVGMIRSAPAPAKAAREAPQPVAASRVEVAEIERPRPPPAVSAPPPVVPPVALSIDDELAAAIDAEIGNLITDRRPVSPEPALMEEPTLEQTWPEPEPPTAPPAQAPKGPFAALRRTFFRR
jgi:hypothetical protein